MQLEPIGILTLLAGLFCLSVGPRFSTFAQMIATLLGAAAGVILTAMGGANIQPAHLLLVFTGLDLVRRPQFFRTALGSLAMSERGFWLLLTVLYGLAASYILPRLFAGQTSVFSVRGEENGGIVSVPLAPTTGNITQSIYFAGDLVCYLIFYAYASRPDGLKWFARAGLACAFINVFFAVLDVVTFYSHTADLLHFIRNSSYRMLDDVELGSFKRVVGSFAEASSFAYATAGLFAFTFELWLRRIHPKTAGLACFLNLLALLSSTSTTGYIGLGVYVVLRYALAGLSLSRGTASRNDTIFSIYGPLLLVAFCMTIWLYPPTRNVVSNIIDITIVNKLDSDSGLERAAWNTRALQSFFDTNGFGAGIGSVRASSWPIAVLANIGFVGAFFYAIFVGAVLFRPVRGDRTPFDRAVQQAARMSCMVQVIALSVAGSSVDLGLPFFIMAGAASGLAQRRTRAAGPEGEGMRAFYPIETAQLRPRDPGSRRGQNGGTLTWE